MRSKLIFSLPAFCLAVLFLPATLLAQASFQAQLRGVVTDASGAALTNATVTVTENGTNVPHVTKTNASGEYFVGALRPSSYSIKVEAPGFRPELKQGVVLQVDQASSLNFAMHPAGTHTEVEVSEAAPLLDTDDSSLGTDITNEYVKQIPLPNRNFFGLVFLNAGVSEVAGSGTNDNYPAGTNFVSNGQRNATAEVRVDGSLISAPEQGEGGNSNVYYEPSVEAVQEFKVQSSAYSAEFGSNGGTVVNMALKSGTNAFHGSGWWFGQRSWLDANDFFSNQAGLAKPDHSRDQYGFAVGGPIKKNKTFFFFDIERVKETDPVNIVATVPTADERNGNFSSTMITDPNTGDVVPNNIYNPFVVDSNGTRAAFQGNVIPGQYINSIGQQLINLYPMPNQPGSADGTNNYRSNTNSKSTGYQLDVKIDHQLTDKHHIGGRYSHAGNNFSTPTIFGDGEFNDGLIGSTNVNNAGLQHDWTISPTLLLSSRFSVDRVRSPGYNNKYPTLSSVGLPSILAANGGNDRMPALLTDSPWTSLFDQCCVDTNFAHTLYSYSSVLSWSHGKHNFKFGGEQRMFFNNFQQPSYPTGYFHFGQTVTEQSVGAFDPVQGNPFADILLGIGDYGGISVYPAVSNKSLETAFYVQDEWKITPKLTLSLGLRYEWSTPYTERFNRIQYSDFTGQSGVSIAPFNFNQDGVDVSGPWNASNLLGTTLFPGSGNRHIPVDRNNWAPRLGFAYALTPNTVVRGGAGVYYGMSVATNFQYTGTAFRKDGNIYFTLDNFQSQYATFANPFPAGLPQPQGTAYGPLAMWGLSNSNDLGTQAGQNADIYQWSFGVQRLLPWQMVFSVDYSANRSEHLPWGGAGGITTRDRNYIPSYIRRQFNTQTLYNDLHNTVTNPFYSLFQGPNAIFNQPDSIYNNTEIPLINLLRPYPQFDGPFEGLPILGASSWYNALQIRFQKRMSNYISFEGGYTFSKATDDSSVGRNAWVGSLASDNPQELDNLKREWSIGANDATNRLAFAVVAELPIGRGRYLGSDMNRWFDGVVGGWTLSSIITLQTGQPLAIGMSQPTLDDGNQRPNVICNPNSGISPHSSALNATSMFDSSCFADPGYEQPGNAPRYFSNLRTDGIHNVDFSFAKSFVPHEGMKLEVRGDFFNFFNTPRFGPPDTLWGDSTFGQVSYTLGNPRHGQFGLRFEF